MSCWYYSSEELENRTPSREDGVPLCVENRYRRDGARFIISASNTLGLRYETPATGVVFFHRFFMIQSFKQFNRWVVAAACLFLAGKAEETPKKCKDVLKVTQSILTEQQMANFGNNPKEELLTHERILLQTIKFDLQVQHPYSYLLKFAKSLKGEKQKMEKLVQNAWTFVNDSLSTVLCLQWEPQAIAVAFLYLAGKLAKYDLQSITQSKSRSWWRQFVDTLDIHDLDTICHQVLDTYGEAADSSSTSQDEEDVEVQPHQTPPSTASIPPSLSVTQSGGGVGHTTSSHLPLPAMQQQQAQLLTQHPPPPPPPHPSPRPPPQAQLPQGVLSSLQTTSNLSAVASAMGGTLLNPSLQRPPGGGGGMSNLTFQNFQNMLPRAGANISSGIPQAVTPSLQGGVGLVGGVGAQTLGYSTLNVSLANASTLQQQLSQTQAALLLSQQQQLRRGTVRSGAEVTPPPAKRHAMEVPYRSSLPQPSHHHLSSALVGAFTQQQHHQQQQQGSYSAQSLPPLNNQQQASSHMYGASPAMAGLPSPSAAMAALAQLQQQQRPGAGVPPNLQGFNTPDRRNNSMAWQQK